MYYKLAIICSTDVHVHVYVHKYYTCTWLHVHQSTCTCTCTCTYTLYIMLYMYKTNKTGNTCIFTLYMCRGIYMYNVYIMYTYVPCIKLRQWCPPQAIWTTCLVLGNWTGLIQWVKNVMTTHTCTCSYNRN